MLAAFEEPARSWSLLLGQLHPVVLHLPIGALAVLGVVELCCLRREQRALRRLVLWFATVSTLLAAASGWLLGEGDYAGPVVDAHRQAGLWMAGLMVAATVVDASLRNRAAPWLRRALLLAAASVMAVVGHLGGVLTHGRGFLERGAPEAVASWLRDFERATVPAERQEARAASGQASAVHAVLERHCIECHGPDKQKGRLRLDTPDGLQATVVAGDVLQSELLRRMFLPPGDEEVMPPDGAVPADELATLVDWVRRGAPMGEMAAQQSQAAEQRRSAQRTLAQVERAAGARLAPLPGDGAGLRARLRADAGAVRGGLRELEGVADRIGELVVAGEAATALFARGCPPFANLRRVHLENTDVGDDEVAMLLAAAPNVRYLNLHHTNVTGALLPVLGQIRALERVALFGTAVTAFEAKALAAVRADVSVTREQVLPAVRDRARRILAADASKGRIALLREQAIGSYDVLWQHAVRQLHDLQWLGDGRVLFQESWTRLLEVDVDSGEVVWSYDAATQNRRAGERVEIHSFQRLADGVTMIAESGAARIVEVARDGTLRHELRLQVDAPHIHHDTRLVRATPNGTYLVAHERDGVVREYARDGEVVWSYQVPLFGRERASGHGADAWGNQLFSAQRLASGNTLVATGNGHRVLEVDPAGEIVWQLTADDVPGMQLAWLTTVQVLDNGNLVLGNCHAGDREPQLFEVTRAKQVVWTFRDFERFGNALSNSYVFEPGR